LRDLAGLYRSLRTYRRRAHLASLTQFCADLAPGAGLVFDIGAHVGDRVTAFRRLGAKVVAVEPQPLLARYLRLRFALDAEVTVVEAGLGAAEGQAELQVNRNNPTVSTLSDGFIKAADGAAGWEGQVWDATRQIDLTTLDALIDRHGVPDFIKIDTEGHEAEVLRGLTRPVPALSFEITTIAREAGLEALQEARRLGFARYRLSLGESHAWHGPVIGAEEMAAELRDLPDAANSGDVVAWREG
jgi:FkbM family methyltransferase